MNCREYIIEFEERGTLSEPARLHLTVCADCRKASERQTNIWLLIDDFKPVAAPNDFDFRVKAKIANAKPSDFQKSSFAPVLRYVLPLSVAVLLLGVFVFNAGFFSDAPNASSPIAQKGAAIAPLQNDLPNAVFANRETAFAPSAEPNTNGGATLINANSLSAKQTRADQTSATKTENEPRRAPKPENKNQTEGGSRDFGVGGSDVRTPLGINLNVNAATAPRIEPPKTLGDDGIFRFLGIQTTLENGKRTVKSLTENSPAARSGVRIGDVIEKAAADSLTVIRAGEKMEIKIR